MERFEYKTLIFNASFFLGVLKISEMDVELNRYGAAGWEITGMVDLNAYQGGTKGLAVIMKRIKSPA